LGCAGPELALDPGPLGIAPPGHADNVAAMARRQRTGRPSGPAVCAHPAPIQGDLR
jgi:hypothetical protein